MRLDPDRPYADDTCFDDTYALGLDIEGVNLLAERGLVFLTHLRVPEQDRAPGGSTFRTGRIIASGWRSAARIAEERGLGEVVCHRLDELYRKPGGSA